MNEPPLLEVHDLRTYFYSRSGVAKAVDGVSFYLRRGETLGIVGESGSGKSVTALSILRLIPEPAGRIEGGRVIFDGEDLLLKSKQAMTKVRGRDICMIPQDPLASLNPMFTVGEQLLETLRRDGTRHARRKHRVRQSANAGKREPMTRWERAVQLLHMVKISTPELRMRHYPHEMSGGMRQRALGAIALSRRPRLIIADEPTTSLDATTQLQYLELVKSIQAETGVSIVFITHDLGIVARVCDRVAVMYAGQIVETADVQELFTNPSHPYTEALINSLPDMEKEVDFLPVIGGEPPTSENLPVGCRFAPRCPYAFDRCRVEAPFASEVKPGHVASCWKLTSG